MINFDSIETIGHSKWTPHFNRPLYDSYSFSLLPATVSQLLTGKGGVALPPSVVGGQWELYDRVVLFLIDGFGWEFFQRYQDSHPFLKRFGQEGVISKISSQFPSTTAAHVTTMNTGMEVGQTGIYEWFYHEPKVGEVIAPLVFSYAGEHVTGTLLKEGYTSHQIFPFTTFYQQLHHQGVRSVAMQPQTIAHSPYSKALLAGAENIPYVHFAEVFDHLRALSHSTLQGPTYVVIYFGEIDAMGHRHGIDSPEFIKAIDHCWNLMESLLRESLSSSQKTAVLITADHGMAPVDPKKTIYLNRLMPDISKLMQKSKSNKPLIPAGSCRDFFLYCQEELLEELQQILQEKLTGIADVVKVEELLKSGFFGKERASRRLKSRIGNLVILPYLQESVWWYEKHRFEQHFFAAHGGLTPAELESVLLYASFN